MNMPIIVRLAKAIAQQPLHCGISSRLWPLWVIRVGHDREDTAGYVRFAPKADKRADVLGRPLCATSCREQMHQYTSVLSRALQWDRVETGPCNVDFLQHTR
jgi:hypothetical protein